MASVLMRSLFRTKPSTLRMVSQVVASRGYADKMSFTFASPYEVFYNNADVKQVDVPSYSGNFGILANHVPALAVIKPGVVTVIDHEGSAKKYFVSSGTITINDDSSVQVLAEEAVPVEWLDAAAARQVLADAQSKASKSGTDTEKAEAAVAVEVGEALVKAVE